MKLRLINCKNVEQKEQLKNAFHFTVGKLFRKRKKLAKNITITINVNNQLADKEKSWGYCQWEDNNHSPRKFLVVLHNNKSQKRLLLTLMHELVHVKQYANGELKDYRSGAIRWKKKKYSSEQETDILSIMSTPWEKQAYKLSEEIYTKYKNCR